MKRNHSITLLLIGGLAIGTLVAGPGFVRRDTISNTTPQTIFPEGELMGITASVDAFETFLKYPDATTWQFQTTAQSEFLRVFPVYQKALTLYSPQELHVFVAQSHVPLNAELKKAGYSIELEPFDQPSIGAVSIIDLNFEWLNVGITEDDDKPLVINGKPSFRLSAGSHQYGKHDVQFSETSTGETVVGMSTKVDGDYIVLCPHKEKIAGVALYEFARRLINLDYQFEHDVFEGVEIPMVDYRVQMNIEWLKGMRYGDAHVAQAKQEVTFKMNHNGGCAGSGTAMVVSKGPSPKFFTINGPFVFVYCRNNTPLFACYVTEQFFKDPAAGSQLLID